MATTQAKGGFGTKFQRSADGGATYTTIAEVGDISGADITKITDDATHMESPNGFEEKIAVGLHQAAPVTFQMALLDADTTQALLRSDNAAGTAAGYYQLLMTSGRILRFRGFVTKIGNSFPMRSKMVHSVEITVTGQPTWI